LLGRWIVGLLSLESCCGRPKIRNSVLEGLRHRKLDDMKAWQSRPLSWALQASVKFLLLSLSTYTLRKGNRLSCDRINSSLLDINKTIAPLTIPNEDEWGDLKCLYKASQSAISDGAYSAVFFGCPADIGQPEKDDWRRTGLQQSDFWLLKHFCGCVGVSDNFTPWTIDLRGPRCSAVVSNKIKSFVAVCPTHVVW